VDSLNKVEDALPRTCDQALDRDRLLMIITVEARDRLLAHLLDHQAQDSTTNYQTGQLA
jgi:hypothetical protein